jgi:predicted GNAT family acetyltransferase
VALEPRNGMTAGAPDPGAGGGLRVEREDAAGRFVLLDGERRVGMLTYRVHGDAVVLVHTEIDPAEQRRGLGTALVTGALEQLRAAGSRVVPRCPFVRAVLETHPEYAGLVAGAGS